ncbi:hypothetical protein ACH5RR_000380 [Cinchona calisaya]|uniref:Uncharacterized protein n=1 Tax=Cinchona calisaya TaxID=153742 RepID=A0ABD3B0J6_9GENT
MNMVKLVKLQTLQEAMKADNLQEKTILAIKQLHKPTSSSNTSQKTFFKTSSSTKIEPSSQPNNHQKTTMNLSGKPKINPKPVPTLPSKFRRMSPAEYAEKKKKKKKK